MGRVCRSYVLMPPQLLTFDHLGSLSRVAAEMLVFQARQAIEERGFFTLALSGGSTPRGLYKTLADVEYVEQVSWPQTHVFWGDERCVPPDHEESNFKQAWDLLLSKVPIPEENIYRMRGELPPEETAADYARQLKKFCLPAPLGGRGLGWGGVDFPRFDVVLLGMGTDGHTASLFPGQEHVWDQPAVAVAVTANYAGRPAPRVSLTPRVFNAARQVFFLVAGADKAEMLRQVLDARPPSMPVPASRIRPEKGRVTWFVDREAASLLPA